MIREIGHLILYVSDLDRSRAWYRDVLGMELVADAEILSGCFLSFGTRDHDIALIQDEVATATKTVHHIALRFDGDLDGLKAFHRRLLAKGVTVERTVDHGISYGVYFLDPDGHRLEVFLEQKRPEATRVEALRAVGAKSDRIDLQAL